MARCWNPPWPQQDITLVELKCRFITPTDPAAFSFTPQDVGYIFAEADDNRDNLSFFNYNRAARFELQRTKSPTGTFSTLYPIKDFGSISSCVDLKLNNVVDVSNVLPNQWETFQANEYNNVPFPFSSTGTSPIAQDVWPILTMAFGFAGVLPNWIPHLSAVRSTTQRPPLPTTALLFTRTSAYNGFLIKNNGPDLTVRLEQRDDKGNWNAISDFLISPQTSSLFHYYAPIPVYPTGFALRWHMFDGNTANPQIADIFSPNITFGN